MSETAKGLYAKFSVTRTDGQGAEGKKHDGCEYFVLDLTHDEFAVPAIRAYIDACKQDYPRLADDLRQQINGIVLGRIPDVFPGPRDFVESVVRYAENCKLEYISLPVKSLRAALLYIPSTKA